MLWALLSVLSPSPAPEISGEGSGMDLNTLIPLVTGAGGALVVLLLVVFLFATDKITTVGAVRRLREADNNRFTDMLEQRDSLVVALERANSTAAAATDNAQQSLELIHDLMPPHDGHPPSTRRRS